MDTSEIDRQRGDEVRRLGELVLPITQAIDKQLNNGLIMRDVLDCQRLAIIYQLISLVPQYMDIWENSILDEVHSDAFSATYRHSVSSPLHGMINKIAALIQIKTASMSSAPDPLRIQDLFTHIIGHYRDHVRRLGLLLTAQNGIFDHDTVSPDWQRSLPASVPVFDCNTQAIQQVTSHELLTESCLKSPIWEPSAIVFQSQKIQWERVKHV